MLSDDYPILVLGKKIGWVGTLGGKKKYRKTPLQTRLPLHTNVSYLRSALDKCEPATTVATVGNSIVVVSKMFKIVLNVKVKNSNGAIVIVPENISIKKQTTMKIITLKKKKQPATV